MSDLKPCPFCGGEAETLTAESMHGGYLFGIMCNDCRSRGDVYDTEAEAIAAWNSRADYHGYEQAAIEAWESIKAWNSRAERITDDEWESYQHSVPATDENMAKFGWVRERTCHETTIDKFFNGCDSCGYMWQFFYSIGKRERPNYCPSCGARVVE